MGVLTVLAAAAPSPAATFTVITTADSGAGSLRQVFLVETFGLQ